MQRALGRLCGLFITTSCPTTAPEIVTRSHARQRTVSAAAWSAGGIASAMQPHRYRCLMDEAGADQGLCVGTETAAAPTATEVHAPWWRKLWVHVLALTIVLVGLLLWIDTGSVGFPDEGQYAAQADNLSDGSWARDLPAPEIDPDGEWISASGSTVVDGQYIPYARHALYPILLVPFVGAGTAAMMLTSIAGVVLAATCAALVARRLNPSIDVPTLWLVGAGSPLLFSAFFVGGHALAAGLTAFLALLIVWIVDDRQFKWMAAAIPVTILLTIIRSEGAVAALALAGVMGLQAIRWREPRKSDGAVCASATALGAAVVLAFLVDSRITRLIAGGSAATNTSIDRGSDFLTAGYAMVVRPFSGQLADAAPTLLVVLPGVILAGLVYRLLPRFRLLAIGIVWLVAIAAVAAIPAQPNLVSGLLVAFPAAVLGIMLLDRNDFANTLVVRLLGSSLLATLVILSTTYAEGGSTEWGGRFLHLLIPLLAVPAVLGLYRAWDKFEKPEARLFAGAVVVLTLALGIRALQTNHAYRTAAASTIATTMTAAEAWTTSDDPVIAVAGLSANGNGRIFWRQIGDGVRVFASDDVRGLVDTMRAVSSSGTNEMLVAISVDGTTLAMLTQDVLDELGWEVLRSLHAPAGSISVTRVGVPPTER